MSMPSRLSASVALPVLLALPAAAETTVTFTEAFGPAANWALHSDDSWLAKRAGKPLWLYLADMSPEQIVSAIDFRHIADALPPSLAQALAEIGLR